MFKLLVLCAIIAVATAGLVSPIVYPHTLGANLGSAVSHQSSFVVHNNAAVTKSIITPVVQTPVGFVAPDTHVYSSPAITHTIVDGSSHSLSQSYVAEPDSVRFSEQSQNTATKSVYSSPTLVQIAAPPLKYLSPPVHYSAPAVHAL